MIVLKLMIQKCVNVSHENPDNGIEFIKHNENLGVSAAKHCHKTFEWRTFSIFLILTTSEDQIPFEHVQNFLTPILYRYHIPMSYIDEKGFHGKLYGIFCSTRQNLKITLYEEIILTHPPLLPIKRGYIVWKLW